VGKKLSAEHAGVICCAVGHCSVGTSQTVGRAGAVEAARDGTRAKEAVSAGDIEGGITEKAGGLSQSCIEGAVDAASGARQTGLAQEIVAILAGGAARGHDASEALSRTGHAGEVTSIGAPSRVA
jgi:hypothetical protein